MSTTLSVSVCVYLCVAIRAVYARKAVCNDCASTRLAFVHVTHVTGEVVPTN